MDEIIRKLTSRKLWAAAAGMAAGLAMVFGLDADVVATTAGAVVALSSAVTYILTEGRVDAERVKTAADAVQAAADALERAEDGRA